ncbi:MAG: helix-turn-helix transcriptional regulator [Oscillospiraceae bacterium]
MEESGQKKRWIIYLYRVLQKYTDENHPLTQKEIGDMLYRDYGIRPDRKAISRNLEELLAMGIPLACHETTRLRQDGTNEILRTDWYIEHEFTNSELRLLIDGIVFSKHIPSAQRLELMQKLEGLSSVHFHSPMKNIRNLAPKEADKSQLFYTIEVLEEAISDVKQVEFEYCSYDIDKQLKPRLREDGSVRKYRINPYQMVTKHGRYYLICNYAKYEGIAHYRIDRIREIRLLDTPATPCPTAVGEELAQHMQEHIYMFTGESIPVTLRVNRNILNDVIDYFGFDVEFSHANDTDVLVSVRVNEEDVFRWAVQYCTQAEIISPSSLRQRVADTLTEALKQYGAQAT